MYTPTKRKWQIVIDNFQKVLPLAILKDHLDMSEAQVNDQPSQCGTIHCVGGWYAIATCDTNNRLDFKDGANSMANHLGFRYKSELEHWAKQNLAIWGNIFAGEMFYDNRAYNEAKTLGEIIEYLKGVRDRSPE